MPSKKFAQKMEELKAPSEEIDLHILEGIKRTLQTIFDSIENGIFVINRGYEIVRANKAVLNKSGKKSFREILERKCFNELYQRATICDGCQAEKTFEEGTSTQLTKISKEIAGKKSLILNTSTFFPIKGEEGDVIQVIEYIKDTTDAVKLEEQLLHIERLAGIGKLAAGIAHGIRNPLGNIKAAAQLCLDKYGTC